MRFVNREDDDLGQLEIIDTEAQNFGDPDDPMDDGFEHVATVYGRNWCMALTRVLNEIDTSIKKSNKGQSVPNMALILANIDICDVLKLSQQDTQNGGDDA